MKELKDQTVTVHGKPMVIRAETILAARQKIADNQDATIVQCQEETDPWFKGWDQSRKDKVIAGCRERKREALEGQYDHTLGFLQSCIYIQTGQSVPILGA